MSFKTITPKELTSNPFELIGDEWMLITAGNNEEFNTMTASWGGFGIMWHRPVVFIVVRPQRHTFSYLELENKFTLSFLKETYKEELLFCGKNSGKDVDKFKETGLTPYKLESGAVAIDEAHLIIECKKLYGEIYNPNNFQENFIHDFYPAKDYHKLYIAEITNCLSNIDNR